MNPIHSSSAWLRIRLSSFPSISHTCITNARFFVTTLYLLLDDGYPNYFLENIVFLSERFNSQLLNSTFSALPRVLKVAKLSYSN